MHHAHIDKFAYQDSAIHRLDPRLKFLVVLIFSVMVLALPPTSVSILACYAVGPFAVLVLGGIPLRFVAKQILLVSPFVVVLAVSSVFYDKSVAVVDFGPWHFQIGGGWVRCFSISGKFAVTMMALICLISTTRFGDLLAGLGRMGLPKILIIQLGFLYRYIFLLIDTGHHIVRARAARRLRGLGFKKELKIAAAMLGSLLIRSIDKAEQISIAMEARNFSGDWHTISKLKFCRCDLVFVLVALIFMAGLYFFVNPIFLSGSVNGIGY